MTTTTAHRVCIRCDHPMTTYRCAESPRFHSGRGLCNACYDAARQRGELIDYERHQRSRDEFLDEWLLLRGQGYTLPQIAERLGMTRAAVDQALRRARAAGDPRAVPAVRTDLRAPHRPQGRAAALTRHHRGRTVHAAAADTGDRS